MANSVKIPKKLIEVALPLDDINKAAAAEKQPGIGAHPRGLHLWWARRPLAAARAVIFAQMVNDPGGERGYGKFTGQTKEMADEEREKLFHLLREIVKWENISNEQILAQAREAIQKSWVETCELNKGKEGFDPERLPPLHDPFAGGGAIPLEAKRLGVSSFASDLNPVSVLINKAMIEIPSKFVATKPVANLPTTENYADIGTWGYSKGLAEDVRRYGHWIWQRACEMLGNLYPEILVTENIVKKRKELRHLVNKKIRVIAWLWTRTCKCPNPACGKTMPLLSSFMLSAKKGKEIFLYPKIEDGQISFEICRKWPSSHMDPKIGYKRGTSGIFECAYCGKSTTRNYTADYACKHGLGVMQTAVICDGGRGKIYLPAQESSYPIGAVDKSGLAIELSPNPRDVWCRNFGLLTPADLFTDRQLFALITFSELIDLAHAKVIEDAKNAGFADDGVALDAGGSGATAYADAVAVYLAFAVSRLADYNSMITTWKPSGEQVMQTFKRQALPMVWDFAESNVIIDKSICWLNSIKYTVDNLIITAQNTSGTTGRAVQADASVQRISSDKVISTDPPYYDNIGYSDISDFFYVWLRKILRPYFGSLFATISVPKTDELIAVAYRHGSKDKAEEFFLNGMTKAMTNLAEISHQGYPLSIYYAFKQSETKNDNTASAGWESFLEAVLGAGLCITGTWPMRTEQSNRIISAGTNALASSVVIICRKRPKSFGEISRRQFQRELRETMPQALETMIGGTTGQSPIAPVDLAQAAIGPGMAVFSKYSAVLNQDGTKMTVHDALVLINREITDYLNPESGSFDADTLFCSSWFDQYGWTKAAFGEADTLARAKGTSVDIVKHAGIIESGGGKVRLLKWSEYPAEWDPKQDNHTPVWEACHHLIRTLLNKGESESGRLLARMPERGESIRQLAYHLYTLCERKKWAEDARAYNTLVTSWHEIVSASNEAGHVESQVEMDL